MQSRRRFSFSATASVLCFLFIFEASAGDKILLTYSGSGTPFFSTVASDNNRILFINAPLRESARHQDQLQRKAEAFFGLIPLIKESSIAHEVDPALISALIDVESGFNARARSNRGAVGLMQLIPATATRFGIGNPYDPHQNIEGGIRYLKELLMKNGGNLPLALAAYNSGPGRVMDHHQRIPPFEETMIFVPMVLAKIGSYRQFFEQHSR